MFDHVFDSNTIFGVFNKHFGKQIFSLRVFLLKTWLVKLQWVLYHHPVHLFLVVGGKR